MEPHANHGHDSSPTHDAHSGHQDHVEHSALDHSGHMGNLKQKFFVSLVISIPIILASPMMGQSSAFVAFPGSDWLVLALATFLFFYGGMPFLKGAAMEMQQRNPGMMMLISLGITVSYVYSVYAFLAKLFIPHTHVMNFFWELATLIVVMLLGHWIENNAVSNAGNALQKMAELLPGMASVLDSEGNVSVVPLKDVNIGDRVLVKSGDKIPTDGIVISGTTSVNESLVTGESKAETKTVGDKVIGGSVNGRGPITVEVTGTGESGYLAQVMELVRSAQSEKSPAESMSDKVAKWLFYVAVSVGILAFVAWFTFTRDPNIALERMVTVLIIACPHALGLAIPLVSARSTSLGAQNGLLVKRKQALETVPKVDVIVMDKTGTLTEGSFKVNAILSNSKDCTEDQVLQLIASLEKNSSHHMAAGVLTLLAEKGLSTPDATDVYDIPGVGIGGTIGSDSVKVVGVSYMRDHDIAYDTHQFLEMSGQGNAVSFLLVNERDAGLVAQGDKIKPESRPLITALNREGIRPVMLTGDNVQVANLIAAELGIDDVRAELKPEEKEGIIREYQSGGRIVMMVGDGVNDAPSLVRADVGVAIGAGTDVAIDSADVILVKSNPADILHLRSLARNTTRKMKQNLWWGAGYNIAAIPLAAGVLAFAGVVLTPAVGAALMSLSTIIVAINAMTLKIE